MQARDALVTHWENSEKHFESRYGESMSENCQICFLTSDSSLSGA